MLKEYQDEEFYRLYVAQNLWTINSIQHLKTTKENTMPQYAEIVYPELKPKEMTAEEIKQHILERLK